MTKNSLRTARERQRRTENRETILHAAEDVILRKGFAATSMDDVAAEAAFAKATIYRYFKNKAELIFEILIHYLEDVDIRLRAIRSEPIPVREKLRKSLAYGIRFETEKENIARVFLLERSFIRLVQAMVAERGRPSSDEERRFIQRIRAQRKAIIDGGADLFREGIASGELRPMDPTAAARFFDAVVEGYFVELFWRETKPDIDKDTAILFEFLIHGFENRRT